MMRVPVLYGRTVYHSESAVNVLVDGELLGASWSDLADTSRAGSVGEEVWDGPLSIPKTYKCRRCLSRTVRFVP